MHTYILWRKQKSLRLQCNQKTCTFRKDCYLPDRPVTSIFRRFFASNTITVSFPAVGTYRSEKHTSPRLESCVDIALKTITIIMLLGFKIEVLAGCTGCRLWFSAIFGQNRRDGECETSERYTCTQLRHSSAVDRSEILHAVEYWLMLGTADRYCEQILILLRRLFQTE